MTSIQKYPNKPAHVPDELVRDIDYFQLAQGSEDVHLAWRALLDGPRFVWTPRHGGHWIATRADDIYQLQVDYESFSSTALTIPRAATPSLPVESDPPYHTALRAIISPLFTPDVLKRVQDKARDYTKELIEGFRARGHCEFVGEFARRLPIAMFLNLVDLPLSDSERLLELVEVRFRSSDADARNKAKDGILAYLADVIQERRKNPGADFISRILHANVGERALTESETQNLLATLMSGGLDTVASSMGFVMRFLAMHPEHRAQLVANPSLIPAAVDELLRRHGISNTARLVMRDMNYKGVELKKGEQILAPNLLYNLDPDQFAKPLDVDFGRADAGRHASFGNGVHRCPGANIARLELRLMLEEWLPRIPDFSLDPEHPPRMATGIANAVLFLPLVWKP